MDHYHSFHNFFKNNLLAKQPFTIYSHNDSKLVLDKSSILLGDWAFFML